MKILDRAAEAGINFLDSADGYPMAADFTLVGRTEEIVGRWLKGEREKFIVATKGAAPMGPEPWNQGASRKHLLDAIDGSLRRLGTDHVELYQVHFDDPAMPLDETLETPDTIVRSGKARYIGELHSGDKRSASEHGVQNENPTGNNENPMWGGRIDRRQ